MWLLCLPPPRVLLLCCFVAYQIELRTERQNVPCQAAPSPILGAISPLKARGAQGQTDRWEHKFRPSKEQGFCPGSSQGCPSRASGTTPMEMCNLWIPAWDKEQLSGSLPGIRGIVSRQGRHPFWERTGFITECLGKELKGDKGGIWVIWGGKLRCKGMKRVGWVHIGDRSIDLSGHTLHLIIYFPHEVSLAGWPQLVVNP